MILMFTANLSLVTQETCVEVQKMDSIILETYDMAADSFIL